MKWFYAQGQQQAGPVEDAEFERLIQAGVIQPETLVWREGMASWQALSAVRVPAAAYQPPAYQQPQPYQAPAPPSGYAPPAAQPGYVPPPNYAYAGQNAQGYHYAGFWIRVLARIIDSLILNVVFFIVCFPLGLLFGLGSAMTLGGSRFDPESFGPAMAPGMIAFMGLAIVLVFAIQIGYDVYFVSKRGATPGKIALGLKIIREDGGPISMGLALGRYFAGILSGMILWIGYIMAAFDVQKRALHDHICHTRVIHTR